MVVILAPQSLTFRSRKYSLSLMAQRNTVRFPRSVPTAASHMRWELILHTSSATILMYFAFSGMSIPRAFSTVMQ